MWKQLRSNHKKQSSGRKSRQGQNRRILEINDINTKREMNMVQLNIYPETGDKDNANREINMVQNNIKPEPETRIMSTRIYETVQHNDEGDV